MALKRQAILITTDAQTGKDVQTTLAFDINTSASYQNLDTAMRKLSALTVNTYSDTHLVTTTSLNEELAE